MPKMHVKKDDTVMVISGRDKGKRARVLSAMPSEGKVLVEGVNVVKRHTKPRPPKVPQGGILEKALPISASNVMWVCPECSRPVRPAYRELADGTKERYCRKCIKK
jgi:large subunit ribosomal protein L24